MVGSGTSQDGEVWRGWRQDDAAKEGAEVGL